MQNCTAQCEFISICQNFRFLWTPSNRKIQCTIIMYKFRIRRKEQNITRACIAHLTIEWYWSKFQREIIITLKNSSHLEWRVGLSDTILKGTHPGTIYAKFEPYIDASCQVWLHLAKLFQRRRFFSQLKKLVSGNMNTCSGYQGANPMHWCTCLACSQKSTFSTKKTHRGRVLTWCYSGDKQKSVKRPQR